MQFYAYLLSTQTSPLPPHPYPHYELNKRKVSLLLMLKSPTSRRVLGRSLALKCFLSELTKLTSLAWVCKV